MTFRDDFISTGTANQIKFNQVVRVRSIVLQTKDSEHGPKTIKLFVNQPSIGFDEVQDVAEPTCAQIITLSEEDVHSGKALPLRYVRFQTVNSLHVRSAFLSSLRSVIPAPSFFPVYLPL